MFSTLMGAGKLIGHYTLGVVEVFATDVMIFRNQLVRSRLTSER